MTLPPLLILVLGFLMAAAVTSWAQLRPTANRMANDGSDQAAPGKPLLPTLLDGYISRPPWMVAGVDYAVGMPVNAELKNPATINLAAVSIDAVTHILTITGSHVTLNGYDFGLAGGWGIYIPAGVTGTAIQNSRFLVGANNLVPINAGVGAGNLTVRYNTFDGGGRREDDVWALVNYNGSGIFDAQYNSFRNAPDDAIDFSSGHMTTIVEHNVFENLGTSPGSHPDSVQYVGVTTDNSVISFNTIYQPHPSGMQGIQLAAQNGSVLSRTTIANNVIVATKAGSRSMSYSIAIQQAVGNAINGVVVRDNYIDFSGAWGPFYPPGGSKLTFSGNVDMVTGTRISPPSGAVNQ